MMFTSGKVCMWSCCATRNMGNDAIKIFQCLSDGNFRVTGAPPVCIESSCCGCSRHVTSHVVVCAGAVVNMHPTHLWLDSLSRIDMNHPFGVF